MEPRNSLRECLVSNSWQVIRPNLYTQKDWAGKLLGEMRICAFFGLIGHPLSGPARRDLRIGPNLKWNQETLLREFLVSNSWQVIRPSLYTQKGWTGKLLGEMRILRVL